MQLFFRHRCRHNGLKMVMKGLFAAAAILATFAVVTNSEDADSLDRESRQCPAVCQKPSTPTLTQVVQDIFAQGLDNYYKLSPLVKSPSRDQLTDKEAIELQSIRTQRQKFYNVSVPAIVELLNSNSVLTPAQVQQVNDVLSQRITLLAATQCIVDRLAPKFNFTCSQKQTIFDISATSIDLYGVVLTTVSDPKKQPVITPAQAEDIQKLIEKNDENLAQALLAFNAPKTPTLGELLQIILDQGVNAYGKLNPVVAKAPKDTLTPTELDELQAIITQSTDFYEDLLPCVVNKLKSNVTLTPEQIQQVKDVLSQRVTLLTAVKFLIDSIAPKLGYNCVQQKSVLEISTVGIDLYGEILDVVQNTNVQPRLTPAQLAQINKLIADSDKAFNAAFVAFNVGSSSCTVPASVSTTTTTTTTTTTKAPQSC